MDVSGNTAHAARKQYSVSRSSLFVLASTITAMRLTVKVAPPTICWLRRRKPRRLAQSSVAVYAPECVRQDLLGDETKQQTRRVDGQPPEGAVHQRRIGKSGRAASTVAKEERPQLVRDPHCAAETVTLLDRKAINQRSRTRTRHRKLL